MRRLRSNMRAAAVAVAVCATCFAGGALAAVPQTWQYTTFAGHHLTLAVDGAKASLTQGDVTLTAPLCDDARLSPCLVLDQYAVAFPRIAPQIDDHWLVGQHHFYVRALLPTLEILGARATDVYVVEVILQSEVPHPVEFYYSYVDGLIALHEVESPLTQPLVLRGSLPGFGARGMR